MELMLTDAELCQCLVVQLCPTCAVCAVPVILLVLPCCAVLSCAELCGAQLKKTIAYTLTHALPELFPIFLNLALSFPLGVCTAVRVPARVLPTSLCVHRMGWLHNLPA